MFCRKCGKEIPDDSEFCPKCGIKIEVIDDKKETRQEVKAVSEPVQARSPKPVSAITLEKEQQLNDSSLPICKTCGKPVPKGNAFCPICGTDLPKGVISSSRQKDKVPYKYSEAYLLLKKRTNIVVGVIIGLVIIVMIISGKAEVINGEVYTDDKGAGFYVGIVIGLAVLRMTFLGLCRFWHSND